MSVGDRTAELDDALRAWAGDIAGAPIVAAGPLGSGASRRTWGVELADGRELVLREDTGDGPVAGTPLTLSREAAVYFALAHSGLPIPSLVGAHPEGRALLLERAAGTEELVSLPDAARAAVGRDYLARLAQLHRLPVTEVGAEFRVEHGIRHQPREGAAAATLRDIALWRSILETRTGANPTPIAVAAFDWLRADAPSDRAPAVLCHGDAGPGNFLHDGRCVTALLDWEFAHLGDPHDDLAWVAVRNELLGQPFDVPAVFDAWSAETGVEVDDALLEYFRVFVLARMLVSCDATLAWDHDGSGIDTTVQSLLQPWLVETLTALLEDVG